MSEMGLMVKFIIAVKDDPRIGVTHIGLYAALVTLWQLRKEHPLPVFSHEVMPYCKLFGPATYHRNIRQLAEYGYIKYVPSHNHFLASLVYLEF
jgi:hypothetical protein